MPEPSAPVGLGSYLGLGSPACPEPGKVVQLCSVQPSPTHTHTHTHGNASCMDSSLHWNVGTGEPSIGLVWVSRGLLSLCSLFQLLGCFPELQGQTAKHSIFSDTLPPEPECLDAWSMGWRSSQQLQQVQ